MFKTKKKKSVLVNRLDSSRGLPDGFESTRKELIAAKGKR